MTDTILEITGQGTSGDTGLRKNSAFVRVEFDTREEARAAQKRIADRGLDGVKARVEQIPLSRLPTVRKPRVLASFFGHEPRSDEHERALRDAGFAPGKRMMGLASWSHAVASREEALALAASLRPLASRGVNVVVPRYSGKVGR